MKRSIALALLLPSVTLAQGASDISYDHVDFNYYRTDWDIGTTEIDGTGWAGRFSVGIREHVYLSGEYRTFEADGVDDRSSYKRLGFGVHGAIGERFSVFGEAGFKSLDLDLGTGNMEDDPGYLGGGARWYVAEGYELRASADWSEAGSGTPAGVGETAVTFGGDIYLTDVAALSIEVTENDENTTTFLIGLRFYHKKDTDGLRQLR
jgi:hypothetical protein